MLRRFALLLGLGVVATVVTRPGVAVRTIRAIDRRGGLATSRGEVGYARIAGRLAGLHRRAARDIAEISAGRPLTVLDIGAGPGDLVVLLRDAAPAVRTLAVEPSGEMRSIAAQRGVDELAGRAEALPVDDASADLVVSTLSAHHWEQPWSAFREIDRVLAPEGQARIYDVRFAGYGAAEALRLAARAGIDPGRVHHRVLDERVLGLRPYSLITIEAAPAA